MEQAIIETKNKAVFTAGMPYSESTVRRLAELQYNTFNFGRKLGQFALGLALIAAGVFVGTQAAILSLALGCIIIMSLNHRPRQIADQICKQYNGSYPTLKYYFTHSGLRTQLVPEETPYKSLIRLVDDGKYLYFFQKDRSAFMVDRSTVKGSGGVDALKDMAEKKTGLTWKKPFSMIGLRFKDIREGLALSRGETGSIRDSGERLDDRRR